MKIAFTNAPTGFKVPKHLLQKCKDKNFVKYRANIAKYLEENFKREINEDNILVELFQKPLEKMKF